MSWNVWDGLCLINSPAREINISLFIVMHIDAHSTHIENKEVSVSAIENLSSSEKVRIFAKWNNLEATSTHWQDSWKKKINYEQVQWGSSTILWPLCQSLGRRQKQNALSLSLAIRKSCYIPTFYLERILLSKERNCKIWAKPPMFYTRMNSDYHLREMSNSLERQYVRTKLRSLKMS